MREHCDGSDECEIQLPAVSGKPLTRPTRGVYFLANDGVFDIAAAFLSSFRASNPEVPLCLIPFNSSVQKLSELSSRYNFSVYSDEDLLSTCDQMSKRFHGTVNGQYRKLAAWHGEYDEFVYIDSDTIVLEDVCFVFDFLKYFSFIVSHSDMPEIRRWVWKDSIYSTTSLSRKQISYAANTGFIASSKGALSIQQAAEKLEDALALADHMELICAEQPFLNYLIVTSGKLYSSITTIRRKSRLAFLLPVECWGGSKINGISKGRITGTKHRVLLVHWAGQWGPGKFEKKVKSLLVRLVGNGSFKNVRFFMRNKKLWNYYYKLHCAKHSGYVDWRNK